MVTARDICRITGKKKAAVSLFLSRNAVEHAYINGKSKFYDETAEPLASYMGQARKSAEAPERGTAEKPESAAPRMRKSVPPAGSAAQRGENTAGNAERMGMMLNASFNAALKGNVKSLEFLPPGARILYDVFESAGVAHDYNTKAAIAKELIREYSRAAGTERERILFEAKQRKAEAEAEKVKIENAMRRGELIPRAEVKREWGRACGVITSQIHPVGIKIAPQVCALLGAAGENMKLAVQALIDAEIYAARANVKRELGVVD